MTFSKSDLELIEIVSEDLNYLKQEVGPECSDPQLRRASVQLRQLLIEDKLIQAWKLVSMSPKQPIIKAPRIRPKELSPETTMIAGGGNLNGAQISLPSVIMGHAASEEEIRKRYENQKNDLEYPWPLSEYKNSCGIYHKGISIQRRQIVAYVANKKGGAHLDTSRKKDDEAYKLLDSAIDLGWKFGGLTPEGGKHPVYLELLSISQHITSSDDVNRFIETCSTILK